MRDNSRYILPCDQCFYRQVVQPSADTTKSVELPRRRYWAGEFPRGRYYEPKSCRESSPGIVVIGKNPAPADERFERPHFRQLSDPEKVYHQDQENANRFRFVAPYYTAIRRLLKELELNGPILWTEAVKCQYPEIESAQKKKEEPDEKHQQRKNSIKQARENLEQELKRMAPTCIKTHLVNELDEVPDWPVLIVGQETRTLLQNTITETLQARKNWVLAVPHASSSADFDWVVGALAGKNLFPIILRDVMTAQKNWRDSDDFKTGKKKFPVPYLSSNAAKVLGYATEEDVTLTLCRLSCEAKDRLKQFARNADQGSKVYISGEADEQMFRKKSDHQEEWMTPIIWPDKEKGHQHGVWMSPIAAKMLGAPPK